MKEIVIASANLKSAEHIKAILQSGHISVNRVFSSGREILSYASIQPDILVVCGKLSDMSAVYLAELAPNGVDIVLLLPSGEPQTVFYSNLVTLSMPVNRAELLDTVRLMSATGTQNRVPSQTRNADEERLLENAKKIIMNRHRISEREAYRLLQRRSMETGIKITELAKMIGDERNEVY